MVFTYQLYHVVFGGGGDLGAVLGRAVVFVAGC
jgi:hypothetical protein